MTENYIIGIDEAGRGAVVSSLVVAAVSIPIQSISYLLHFKDSKTYTGKTSRDRHNKRQQQAIAVERIVRQQEGICISAAASAEVVDEHIRSKVSSLNKLEIELANECIERIQTRLDHSASVVICDGEFFKTLNIERDTELICIPRADSIYPIVSAASILAKVYRDLATIGIMEEDFWKGAGYPNKYTKEWIENNPDKHKYVRWTWKWINRNNIERQK